MDTLTADYLRKILHYAPDTGLFTWRVSPRRNISCGQLAGSFNSDGYLQISIHNRSYKAHRLAWLYTFDRWPICEIDHINGDKSDNRIENLRDVSRNENQHNTRRARAHNASGFLGVGLHKQTGKWRARIRVNKNLTHIGLFNTPEEAHQAYIVAKRKLHAACTL